MGFPSELRVQVAHPPDFSEVRNNLEFNYIFETNDQGLRYKTIPLAKPADEYRVFVVGDSYTEGVGVAAEQLFTEHLEREFSSGRQVRFINGGLTGTGPLQYGRLFMDTGLRYEPDALLICLYTNDLSNTHPLLSPEMFEQTIIQTQGLPKLLHTLWPHSYAALKNYLDAKLKKSEARPSDYIGQMSGKARQIGLEEYYIEHWANIVPKDLVAAVERGEFSGSILARGLFDPYFWSDSIDLDSEMAEASYKAMIALLDGLVARARERGIEVGLVYIPSPFQYDPRFHDLRIRNAYREAGVLIKPQWLTSNSRIGMRLARWTSEKSLPYLDMTAALRQAASGAPYAYPLDGHWNPQGHKLAAQIMADWLRQDRVFPGLIK